MLETNIKDYWDRRYDNGGNAGAGSYGRLAAFKAEIINGFIAAHGIKTVNDLGCGDGHQLGLFETESYTGYDISDRAVKLCSEKFLDDKTKDFKLYTSQRNSWKKFPPADLSMSLDVIFLLEGEVYETHMRDLFQLSERFVAVYANNEFARGQSTGHIRLHKFTEWVEKNLPDWTLCGYVPNRYPFHSQPQSQEDTSISDFYFFSRYEKLAPKYSCLFDDPEYMGAVFPKEEAEELMRVARESAGANELAKAAECLKAAMAYPGARLQAANNLGAVLAALGRHDEAEDAIKAVLAREPGNRQARINLTKMYLRLDRWTDLNPFCRELQELRQSRADVASRWPLISIKVENLG